MPASTQIESNFSPPRKTWPAPESCRPAAVPHFDDGVVLARVNACRNGVTVVGFHGRAATAESGQKYNRAEDGE